MVERRLTILAAIVLLWGAAILKNLISLQVVHHREYAVRARSIQEVVEDIPAPRGTIFDRDGRPLAMSLASRTVFINPMKVDVGVASDLLGYLLHLDRSELYLKIKQAADAHRGYLIIKRQLSPEEYDNLLNLKSRIDWVSLSHESQRHYPNGMLAAHVLGSVDFEEKGNAGIEQGLDKELRGTPGRTRLLTDVHRRGIAPQTTIPAKPGTSLTLTLDERLQFVAEREIAAAVVAHNANSGSVVVMKPDTGDILAMASYPTFDPNVPVERPEHEATHEPCLQRSLRARFGVQGNYPLGGARNHKAASRKPHQLQRRQTYSLQPHDSRFPRRHVGGPDGDRARQVE
jgi:cell division protein FtsI/penicillin-binding protein 2